MFAIDFLNKTNKISNRTLWELIFLKIPQLSKHFFLTSEPIDTSNIC